MRHFVELQCGNYRLLFDHGGIEVHKNGAPLYVNKRPMFLTVKTELAVSAFYDGAYTDIAGSGAAIEARGRMTLPSGSAFEFIDVYEVVDTAFKVSRNVRVVSAGSDLGFSTKISLAMVESAVVRDYNCFAPGAWYKQNEFAPAARMGKDLDNEYFWQTETRYALPLFAMQNIASGEVAAFSRWAADVTLPTVGAVRSENFLDRNYTVGSIGMSCPKSKTLNYMYYGYGIRRDLEIEPAGLSIDYVYPGADGQLPSIKPYAGLDFSEKPQRIQRGNHPVEVGFEQNYAVAVNLAHYEGYQPMMKDLWHWLVNVQGEDGSFYRAYNADSSIRMDSKSNTPSVIRFLVQFFLVSGDTRYRTAAVRAGEWSFENCYRNLEYRGGTCDNADIQDNEAGIYGIFGFLALYDLTGEDLWLEAALGAADYTETWTYAWSFPVRTEWPKHPFNKYSISGQSIITVGGGADVYMAACSYTYYRLYVITGDEHYRDFAEFIHKNTRQSTDVDGSIGYVLPGLGHESGNFTNQTLAGHYHWLPWCTFVEVDPASRLYDTFGSYEIADAQQLPPEERAKRNRIYEDYGGRPADQIPVNAG